MDRLDAMATLEQVVAEGSFAAAGRRRGIPRAVVSKHVSFLESEFGARFFHRTTRRLSLTEAGARFHEHCLKILAAVRELEQELQEGDGKPRGLLRMTAPSAFTELHLMTHLDRFAELYPAISLDLDCSERFVDFVGEGFDVGIRICTSPPEGLVAKKLTPSSILVCGSPEYLERRGRPKHPADLAEHDCIGWVYQSNAAVWDFGGGSSRQSVKITPRHRTNDNRFLRHLALRGHGLAQLPSYFVADDIAAGRLVTVLDRYRDTSRSIFIVYPHRERLPPKVRALVDHLTLAFAGERRWT
jgi:DNA-binding transcriptional LysR family regulator